ncbi:MAG: Crp/Fnr family transcriptional regulator [Magnetococcales bacterium]|nr:Crp/Fnr family transcriptional regulator [Magnetococcales bacterium]MBF0171830.1 Crp/Fnr family transcriptional regulator [Magnetococcales bacterium]MBF0346127.1 Crp/Fnr family transcriptional regulator [Magnetococcales bacterium]MBF0632359.1 Crp/Fnr family transcriptional regulator [Magnetococcales bacterium]
MVRGIEQHPLIVGLGPSFRERLAQRLVTRDFGRGEAIFHQEDGCHHFFFVVRGTIKLFRLSESGEEKIIELVRAGETFAEAVMFSGMERYPVSAQAVTRVRVILIPTRDYIDLLHERPERCFALLAGLSMRLHHLLFELDRITLQSARERLLSWLRHEAATRGTNHEFRLDISKKDLAARLTIQPETLSRLLRALKEEGRVRERDGWWVVVEEEGETKSVDILNNY